MSSRLPRIPHRPASLGGAPVQPSQSPRRQLSRCVPSARPGLCAFIRFARGHRRTRDAANEDELVPSIVGDGSRPSSPRNQTLLKRARPVLRCPGSQTHAKLSRRCLALQPREQINSCVLSHYSAWRGRRRDRQSRRRPRAARARPPLHWKTPCETNPQDCTVSLSSLRYHDS